MKITAADLGIYFLSASLGKNIKYAILASNGCTISYFANIQYAKNFTLILANSLYTFILVLKRLCHQQMPVACCIFYRIIPGCIYIPDNGNPIIYPAALTLIDYRQRQITNAGGTCNSQMQRNTTAEDRRFPKYGCNMRPNKCQLHKDY